jgi:hypothetical protein
MSLRVKLWQALFLSISIPGVVGMFSSTPYQRSSVWMWAPAGVLTVLSAIDFCITNRKKPLFKKLFFGSIIAADLYFMTHIDKGKTDNPKMVLAFSVTSLFLFGSFLYDTFRIRSETERPRLSFFTKVGLGIFKVIAGTRGRYFWFMSAIYFAGVMVLTIPGSKPHWAWWVGGGTTLMYMIYNLVIMHRNEKEIEARFSGPPMQQRIDPHPAGIDRPVARNRTVEIFVDGESKGTAQLSPRRPDPIVEVLPEPEPDNRFARVLRDNYPL